MSSENVPTSASVRPAKGSSTRTTFGSRAIALASSSRRRSANGRVGGWRSITAPRPTRSAICLARSRSALSGTSMKRLSGSSATMMFSSTVCRFSGRECWNTMPKPLRAILCDGRPARFSPSRRTSPAVGRSIPMTLFMAVDLPEPFGPIRPKISPGRRSKLRFLTAVRPPKRLVSPRTSRMGALADVIGVPPATGPLRGSRRGRTGRRAGRPPTR